MRHNNINKARVSLRKKIVIVICGTFFSNTIRNRDMFGGDFGHCTQKGNKLLAGNIADVILKEVFGKTTLKSAFYPWPGIAPPPQYDFVK